MPKTPNSVGWKCMRDGKAQSGNFPYKTECRNRCISGYLPRPGTSQFMICGLDRARTNGKWSGSSLVCERGFNSSFFIKLCWVYKYLNNQNRLLYVAKSQRSRKYTVDFLSYLILQRPSLDKWPSSGSDRCWTVTVFVHSNLLKTECPSEHCYMIVLVWTIIALPYSRHLKEPKWVHFL